MSSIRIRGIRVAISRRSWRTVRRHGQGIGPAQAQLFLVDPDEVVAGQPIGQRDSGLLDGARQTGEVFGRPLGQTEIGVGAGPGARPQPLVEHQRPEPGMAPAVGQMKVARAQRVANRQGERGFPDRSAQPAVVVAQHFAPAGRDEAGRRVLRQGPDRAVIELADQVDGPQQVIPSGIRGEWQGQKGRQGLAQIRVAGEDGVDHAAAVLGGNRLAGEDGGLQAIGPEALAQTSHGFLDGRRRARPDRYRPA